LNFTFPQEGIPTVTASLIGAKEKIYSTNPMDTTPVVPSKQAFEMRFGKVFEGSTLAQVAFITSGNVQITNNIATDEYVIGSPYRVCATEGRRNISGSIEVLFQNSVMYCKFVDGVDSAIQFELTNAGGDIFRITVPSVRFSGETPTIDDDTGIRLTMNFQGKFSETDNTDLIITLVNDISTMP